jgi:hypothetical protein
VEGKEDFCDFCRCFLKGVLGEMVFFCGGFVVKLWSFGGESWWDWCRCLGSENLSVFEDISVEILDG